MKKLNEHEYWAEYLETFSGDQKERMIALGGHDTNEVDLAIRDLYATFIREKQLTAGTRRENGRRNVKTDRATYYDIVKNVCAVAPLLTSDDAWLMRLGRADRFNEAEQLLAQSCFFDWLHEAYALGYEVALFTLDGPFAKLSRLDYEELSGHPCHISGNILIVALVKKDRSCNRMSSLQGEAVRWYELETVFCNGGWYIFWRLAFYFVLFLIATGFCGHMVYSLAVGTLPLSPVEAIYLFPLIAAIFFFANVYQHATFFYKRCTLDKYACAYSGLFTGMVPIYLYENEHILTFDESKERQRDFGLLP